MSSDIASLLFAIVNNKQQSIKVILDSDININVTDNEGETPLHYAVNNKNVDVVKMLLEHGADPNIMNSSFGTPLHNAVSGNDIDIAKLLLSYGANINAISDNGESGVPLHQATSKNMALLLLSNGADINASDSYGHTPLHEAASDNRTDVCDVLLDSGASIDARSHNGWSPLHWAVWQGNSDIVDMLLSSGVSANSRVKGKECSTGWTPTYWLASPQLKEIGAINLENGWTPLHLAAIRNHTLIIEKLISCGANINATINKHGTPLHWASILGNSEAVEILKKHDAG